MWRCILDEGTKNKCGILDVRIYKAYCLLGAVIGEVHRFFRDGYIVGVMIIKGAGKEIGKKCDCSDWSSLPIVQRMSWKKL